MKKLIFLSILILTCGGFANAARKKRVIKAAKPSPQTTVKVDAVAPAAKHSRSDSFHSWLKDLKRRVSKTNSQSKRLVAVAAVRGDETADAPPLYWKGKTGEGKVSTPEMQDFEAAIDVAMNGDPAAAKEKLQSFVMAYPKSSLVPDANETLSRLDAAPIEP